MVINTFSAFYYGHDINDGNFIIPLNEGSGEVTVELNIGSYSLTNFIIEVNSSLNEFGSQEYSVSLNRSTRRVTISAASNFSLLFGSSVNSGISIFGLLGFENIDYTGQSSYTGQLPSGFAYFPQFKLQNFIDFDLIQRTNSETVRTTASGKLEVVKYANTYFMKCTIPFITDIVGQGVIKNNPNGVEEAIKFIRYATSKQELEFIYDVNSPNVFETCILESTSQSRQGTEYELTPLYSRGLTGYYELRDLEFRRL